MFLWKLLLGLLITSLLSSCAELQTAHPGPVNDRTHIPGLIHVLPYTQFEITLNRRIVGCENGHVRVAVLASANARNVDDYDHTYVLDPSHLSQFMNSTEFSVKFHAGTNVLASVNAEVDDQVGEVTQSFVGAIGTLGRLTAPNLPSLPITPNTYAIIPGLPPISSGAVTIPPQCPWRLVNAIQRAEQATLDLAAKTRTLVAKKRELVSLRVALANATTDDAKESATATIVAATRTIASLKEQVSNSGRTLSNRLRPLTYQNSGRRWPRDGLSRESTAGVEISNEALARMLMQCTVGSVQSFDGLPLCETLTQTCASTTAGVSGCEANPRDDTALLWAMSVLANNSRDQLAVFFSIRPTSNYLYTNEDTETDDQLRDRLAGVDLAGIAHRVGLPGELVICQAAKCGDAGSREVVAVAARINQLGYVAYLPVSSGPLENTEFGATFSPEGRVLSATYNTSNAPARALADLFGGLVEDEETRRDALAEDRTGALTADRDELRLQDEILAAEASIEAALNRSTLTQTELQRLADGTSLLNAETLMLQAQLAQIQAQIQLDAAEADLPQP